MSNTTTAPTTIRATFSNIISGIQAYTVEGFANIKAAQNYARDNAICLDDYAEVKNEGWKHTKHEPKASA